MKQNIFYLLISLLFLFIFTNCNENITDPGSSNNSGIQLQKPPTHIGPSSEVILDRYYNYYMPGESTGWISYNPGTGVYSLRIELIRDIIVGWPVSEKKDGQKGSKTTSTQYSVRLIIKNSSNVTLTDEWIDLYDPYTKTVWKTYSPQSSPHKVNIMVPNDFIDALGAKITLLRNTTF